MHDALLATYPPGLRRVRLRVFAGNHRAQRFYERRGWTATGAVTRTSFPPHPTLLEYVLDRTGVRPRQDEPAVTSGVAGTGTKIRVVQVNPHGMMTIEVQ